MLLSTLDCMRPLSLQFYTLAIPTLNIERVHGKYVLVWFICLFWRWNKLLTLNVELQNQIKKSNCLPKWNNQEWSGLVEPKIRLKVHIFWEGHKILQNLHQLFDWQYIGRIIGGDFAKFCGLLRLYEL